MIQMLHVQILQAHSPVLAMLVIPDLVQHVQVCHSVLSVCCFLVFFFKYSRLFFL